MNKEEIRQIEMAVQQITGFYECYEGGTIADLCNSMGLKKSEYKKMVSDEMIDWLPKKLREEIRDYINQL